VRHELSIDGEKVALGKRSTFDKLVRVRGSLVFSPDVRYAAGSVKSGQFMGVILDVQSGSVLHQIDPVTAQESNQGHEFGCNLAFAAEGRGLVSADHNGRVALWKVPTGELLAELGRFDAEGNHNPPEVAVTADDRVIVAGDFSDSRISIQRLTWKNDG
jgi:hypothetical protein